MDVANHDAGVASASALPSRRRPTPFWLLAAVASAIAGYLLHHSGYFSDHRLLSAVFAVVLASASGVVLVGFIANRRHPEPLPVILATGGSVVVSTPVQEDVEALAAIHARYLGRGLFVSLGPAFLRAYYAGFLSSPYGIASIAKVKGSPSGCSSEPPISDSTATGSSGTRSPDFRSSGCRPLRRDHSPLFDSFEPESVAIETA